MRSNGGHSQVWIRCSWRQLEASVGYFLVVLLTRLKAWKCLNRSSLYKVSSDHIKRQKYVHIQRWGKKHTFRYDSLVNYLRQRSRQCCIKPSSLNPPKKTSLSHFFNPLLVSSTSSRASLLSIPSFSLTQGPDILEF